MSQVHADRTGEDCDLTGNGGMLREKNNTR